MSVDKLVFVQLISAGVVGAWNKIKSEIPFLWKFTTFYDRNPFSHSPMSVFFLSPHTLFLPSDTILKCKVFCQFKEYPHIIR